MLQHAKTNNSCFYLSLWTPALGNDACCTNSPPNIRTSARHTQDATYLLISASKNFPAASRLTWKGRESSSIPAQNTFTWSYSMLQHASTDLLSSKCFVPPVKTSNQLPGQKPDHLQVGSIHIKRSGKFDEVYAFPLVVLEPWDEFSHDPSWFWHGSRERKPYSHGRTKPCVLFVLTLRSPVEWQLPITPGTVNISISCTIRVLNVKKHNLSTI